MTATTRRVAPAKKTTTAAKKATAAKARVRPAKAAPAAPQEQVLEGEVVGDPTDQPVEGLQTAKVPFFGRDIEVRMPTLEQVTVYERVAAKFAALRDGDAPIDGKTATKLYGRAFKVITSIVVNPDDVEFLEDLLLEQTTDLAGLTPLLGQGMTQLKAANAHLANREERRRAKLTD